MHPIGVTTVLFERRGDKNRPKEQKTILASLPQDSIPNEESPYAAWCEHNR